MSPNVLRGIALAMSNIDRDMLEKAGVMKPHQAGGGDWTRFNEDPLTFILKLSPDKLQALANLINVEMAGGVQ